MRDMARRILKFFSRMCSSTPPEEPPEPEVAPPQAGPEPEPEHIPEYATDVEMALFLMSHIDHPCSVEVGEGRRETIREFYLQEAERLLGTITNPHAREFLEAKIGEYRR